MAGSGSGQPSEAVIRCGLTGAVEQGAASSRAPSRWSEHGSGLTKLSLKLDTLKLAESLRECGCRSWVSRAVCQPIRPKAFWEICSHGEMAWQLD